MGLRDIKAKARGDLHLAMRVPALYTAPGGEPIPCYVRVHSKNDALGDMQGTSFNYGERKETIPKLLFWRAEIAQPAMHATVMISPDEGYRLNASDPPDGPTVTVAVTTLSAAERAALPSPTHT